MATKLSDLLKANNLTIDDLEDDELNLSVGEVRKRLKANQDGFTKTTQSLAERDRSLAEHAKALNEWQAYAGQLEIRSKTLEQKIAERAEKVAAAGNDWRRDPLFQDLVGDFDQITAGIKESQEASGALAKGMVGIAQRYTQDRTAFLGFADTVIQRFMKQDHPDFDAEEIRKWAKANGVADSWEGSYTRWRASKMPEIIEETKKKTREEVLTEHGDRLRETPPTEMGGSSRPATPVGGGAKKEYKDSWGGLAGELERIGVGRT